MEAVDKFKIYYEKEKSKLEKIIKEYNETVTDDNDLFKENLELFKKLNSDGKLIRGILINLGYNLLKKNTIYSTKLSLAYEIYQTSILIHDDIIDQDNKRRGKDTIHFANYKKYKKYSNNEKSITHLSNSIGICLGDYGLYLANKVIIDNYANNSNFPSLLNFFTDIVLKTIKGETLDVILPFESKNMNINQSTLEETIMNIYRLKTAYYTIIGPLSIGLILAGTDKNKLADIEKIGDKIGIAFQIQDDILGIYSNQIGKINGSDIKEFKQTILYSYVCKTEYKDELMKYYGNEEITNESISKVKEIFRISGAKAYSENLMNSLYDESLEIINDISWITEDKKELLRGFVDYLRIRKK